MLSEASAHLPLLSFPVLLPAFLHSLSPFGISRAEKRQPAPKKVKKREKASGQRQNCSSAQRAVEVGRDSGSLECVLQVMGQTRIQHWFRKGHAPLPVSIIGCPRALTCKPSFPKSAFLVTKRTFHSSVYRRFSYSQLIRNSGRGAGRYFSSLHKPHHPPVHASSFVCLPIKLDQHTLHFLTFFSKPYRCQFKPPLPKATLFLSGHH